MKPISPLFPLSNTRTHTHMHTYLVLGISFSSSSDQLHHCWQMASPRSNHKSCSAFLYILLMSWMTYNNILIITMRILTLFLSSMLALDWISNLTISVLPQTHAHWRGELPFYGEMICECAIISKDVNIENLVLMINACPTFNQESCYLNVILNRSSN